LSRRYGTENACAFGLFFDPAGEFFGDVEVDVGVEQGTADFTHRLSDVDIADFGLPRQRFEYGI
jgi:hypothetical protein